MPYRAIYCQQGTPEWLEARAGVISASNFKSLFTTRGEKASSTTRETYLNHVIAERICGHPVDTFKNADMERGNEREDEARQTFAAIVGADVKEVGFFMHIDHDIGCSPDGLFSLDGVDTGVELKCPRASTLVKWMRGKKVPSEYVQQIQGTMAILDLTEYWFCAWHPDFSKPFIVRVKRNDELINKALPILIEAAKFVKNETEKLNEHSIYYTN